jgi:hypothetical protein
MLIDERISNLRYSAKSICAHSICICSLISIAKTLEWSSDRLISLEWKPVCRQNSIWRHVRRFSLIVSTFNTGDSVFLRLQQ